MWSPLTKSPERFETFPTFSPDGRWLYFCSAEAVDSLPRDYDRVKYALVRIAFNPEDGSFEDRLETVFDAPAMGKSVSFPRISPDDRWLAFTEQDESGWGLEVRRERERSGAERRERKERGGAGQGKAEAEADAEAGRCGKCGNLPEVGAEANAETETDGKVGEEAAGAERVGAEQSRTGRSEAGRAGQGGAEKAAEGCSAAG